MGYDFELDEQTSVVHPVHELAHATLSIDGRRIAAQLTPDVEPGAFFLDCDGQRERVYAAGRGDLQFIHWRGRAHRVLAQNALERARQAAAPSGGAEVLRAPMPGTVVEVAVGAGAEVEAGQLLLTIESMKLQTAITASQSARVAEICVSAGASFDQGDALVRLEPVDEAGENEGEES